jgi:hypothetical protein
MWVANAKPSHFNTGKEPRATHCTEGWVGPSAGLKGCEKEKISRIPNFQPVASRYIDYAIPVPIYTCTRRKEFPCPWISVYQIQKLENLAFDQTSDNATAVDGAWKIPSLTRPRHVGIVCELENTNWQVIYVDSIRFKLVNLKGTFLTIFSCQMQCGQIKWTFPGLNTYVMTSTAMLSK